MTMVHEPVMLTIGEFSRMTYLSIKALRHYHDVGLLEPAAVDRATGYRSYLPEQVATGQLIRRFRELDMPIEDVHAVLEAPDAAARDRVLTEHLRRMERRLEETRDAVASLRALVEGSATTGVVTYRHLDPLLCAAVEGETSMDGCHEWIVAAYGELLRRLASLGLRPSGPAGALYAPDFFESDAGEVVAYLPIGAPIERRGRVEGRYLPGVDVAVLVHHGAFHDLDRTYGVLGVEVAACGIGAPGPIREHYLVTASDTSDVSRHRTEVCWPVTTLPPA
jgi:DNA-binding transcriptional MerR regulator